MLAQLTTILRLPKTLNAAHLLVLLPKDKTLPRDVPQRDLLVAVLKRRGIKAEEFADKPITANAADGSLIAWAMLDFGKTNFVVQTQARKAMQLLLDEHPASITIVVQGDEAQRRQAAEAVVYAAWVN
ncbi:MAG TPA: leucyl aminopeptidase family protein, partial [Gallionella sp.]